MGEEMGEEHKTRPETQAPPGAKRPYVKPAVVSETIFETTALACGKMLGQGGSCNAVPKLS
jgi:hypothetical protein